jgi:hypothetical protein
MIAAIVAGIRFINILPRNIVMPMTLKVVFSRNVLWQCVPKTLQRILSSPYTHRRD